MKDLQFNSIWKRKKTGIEIVHLTIRLCKSILPPLSRLHIWFTTATFNDMVWGEDEFKEIYWKADDRWKGRYPIINKVIMRFVKHYYDIWNFIDSNTNDVLISLLTLIVLLSNHKELIFPRETQLSIQLWESENAREFSRHQVRIHTRSITAAATTTRILFCTSLSLSSGFSCGALRATSTRRRQKKEKYKRM